MSTTPSSATSLNFIGFDEMRGNGTAPILFNRVVILPTRPETAGKWIHPVAGFVPGQQPYLKRQTQVWNKPLERSPSASRSRATSSLRAPTCKSG